MAIRDKVLIVDDHPRNIAILNKILCKDCSVKAATSGEEALAMAPEFQPDLILLDIMLPGIDGYEVCRRLRQEPAIRNAKILIVSAKAMVSERLEGYAAGADDYVTKPFDADELLAKVKVYLKLKSIEEIDQLKSDVLSLLCHETLTPLNGLIGPAELLMEEELTSDQRQLVEIIQSSSVSLHGLFKKVIKLSALKSHKAAFDFNLTNLCEEIVPSVVSELRPEAQQKNIKIDVILPESANTLVDSAEMEFVVRALLENALRFSPQEERVVVRLTSDDNQVTLSVTDRGQGVDPKFQPDVFTEFPSQDIEHHSSGHGLSLAIARQIVMAHGGTISVRCDQECGSEFTVRLPLAHDNEKIASATS